MVRSGKVKVTISYTNKDVHTISGETMYTPFAVVCGTIVDNENNKNIEVSNGKVIDNGDKSIVIGLALPGMQESLKTDMDIPSSVTISMDSESFELGNVMSYVTPKVLDEDIDFSEFDNLYGKVNTLQSSSKQLVEGANTLKDGTVTYSEKSKEFNSSMKQVQSGVSSASSNYSKIDTGIASVTSNSVKLEAGAKSIYDGVILVSNNLNEIRSAISQMVAGTEKLKQGEAKIIAGIDSIIAELDKNTGLDSELAKVQSMKKLIEKNTAKYKSMEAKVKAGATLTADEQEMMALLKANIDAETEVLKTVSSLAEKQTSSMASLKVALTKLKAGIAETKDGKAETLQNGTNQLLSGQKLLLDKLNQGMPQMNALVNGSKELYNGTSSLKAGAKSLNVGSKQIKAGLNTLDSGVAQLANANDLLVDGANVISDGASTLASGMSKFDSEGIQPICRFVNNDARALTNRVKSLEKLAKDYRFEDDNTGDFKMITIIDSIKEKNDGKEKAILNQEENK